MKRKIVVFLAVLTTVAASCVKDRVPEPASSTNNTVDTVDRKLVHYWDFNGSSLLTPTYTVGGASITTNDTYDEVTPGSVLNVRNGSDTGSALRMRNPSTEMVIAMPTTGYKKPIVSFAVMRTSNGAQENIISYTLDGVNYTSAGINPDIITVSTDWQLYSFDFSDIDSASDNSMFAVKVTFSIGNTATSGNDRYDNITLDAIPLSNTPVDTTQNTDTTTTLIHYWNFNRTTDDTTIFKQPTYTAGGASLIYAGAYMDTVYPGSLVNARLNDTAGSCLRLRNPAGSFTLTLPTTGYKNVKLTFAVMRTSKGAQENAISYSTDGVNFITDGLTTTTNTVDLDFTLITYDFSSVSLANDNASFKVKIDFSNGDTNTSGNDRFDNIALDGQKL